MLEELFRFQAFRPPRRAPLSGVIVFPTGLTLYRRSLRAAQDQPDTRRLVLEATDAHLASSEFFADPTQLAFAPELFAFRAAALSEPRIAARGLTAAARRTLGTDWIEALSHSTFASTRERAFDAVLALKLRLGAHPRLLPRYADLVRTIDLAERLAADRAAAADGVRSALLFRTIALPSDLMPRSADAAVVPAVASSPSARNDELQANLAAVADATARLLQVERDDLEHRGGATLARPAFSASLPVTVRRTMAAAGIDLATTPVRTAVARLAADAERIAAEIDSTGAEASGTDMIVVGGAFLPAGPGLGGAGDFQTPTEPVPPTVGPLRIAGVATLYRVSQHIERYELGEVAHIENILRSERKTRDTRRLHRTEEVFETETETMTELEKDEQTTERSELQKEAQQAASERETFNVDATVTARYGSFLEVTANTAYGTESSLEESRSNSVTFAHEVTNRAVERVSERVRERRARTTIEEFEERYQHGFDNTAGEDHAVGVYQEVLKHYAVEVREMGLRAYLEANVPEPAAMYLRARASGVADTAQKLRRPDPFTHAPSAIHPWNFARLAAKYGAEVAPPPDTFVTVAEAFDGKGGGEDEDGAEIAASPLTSKNQINLPDGYAAFEAHVRLAFDAVPVEPVSGTPGGFGPFPVIAVTVGRRTVNGDDDMPLDDEIGAIPVTVMMANVTAFTAAIEVVCRRTPRRMQRWRIETHAAIATAYRAAEESYRNRLAAALAEADLDPTIRTPSQNRELVLGELRRSVISMLTGQHFAHFGAILESAGMLPRIDFDEAMAEGRYAAFFHRAIEWESILYRFHDYFWGRRQLWLERLLMRDDDAEFAQFLRAGYVRVLLPVRPGFEAPLAHFLETGDVPLDVDVSGAISEPFLDMIEEIKAAHGAGDQGILVDSFSVAVPTSLSLLNADDALPRWERDEDGVWQPVETEDA